MTFNPAEDHNTHVREYHWWLIVTPLRLLRQRTCDVPAWADTFDIETEQREGYAYDPTR
jgi:hypothetical protein